MTLWLALGLGALIGASLGALGGGGAILTVPALVYLLDQTPRDATTGSVIIVGAASVTGMIGYARRRQVRWRLGLLFGVAGILTAYGGTALNHLVNQHYLLIGFAVVMVVAAAGMLLRVRNRRPATASVTTSAAVGNVSDSLPPRARKHRFFVDKSSGNSVAAPGDEERRAGTAVKILIAGLGVGFLTGFFGVGGGFVIVPVLVLLLDLPMPVAVATSLLIIVINSAVSLIARAGSAHFQWSIIVPFTVAAMLASLAGKLVAGRLPDKVLTRTFAVMLIAIGLYVGVQNIVQLN